MQMKKYWKHQCSYSIALTPLQDPQTGTSFFRVIENRKITKKHTLKKSLPLWNFRGWLGKMSELVSENRNIKFIVISNFLEIWHRYIHYHQKVSLAKCIHLPRLFIENLLDSRQCAEKWRHQIKHYSQSSLVLWLLQPNRENRQLNCDIVWWMQSQGTSTETIT